MALPVLYSFRRCPYAMRARLAIAVSGQVCALREVVLRNKPAAILQASPKGTVPVLVLQDGSVMDESLDIMLWALRNHDPQAWLPNTEAAMAAALQCIADCDGQFKGHLDRYKYPNRYALKNGDTARDQGALFLVQLETRLATQPHLAGPHFGLIDAAIAPFVRQFAHTDVQWFAAQSWPHLQRWLLAFETSPRFAQIMEKNAGWTVDAPVRLFPASSCDLDAL